MKEEAKTVDRGSAGRKNEDEERFKWQELPFVSGKSLWDPAKQISAKSRLSIDLIGEEFALAYLKLIKNEWPRVGLVSLFFLARDMSKGMHFKNCAGIERAFFDMIDLILKDGAAHIPMDKLRVWNRARLVSRLTTNEYQYPKTWQLEALKTMGQLDELLWKSQESTGDAVK